MTANANTAEDRLAKLGLQLPDPPTPFGAYVPAVQTGNLLFLSGMLATVGHQAKITGIVGNSLMCQPATKQPSRPHSMGLHSPEATRFIKPHHPRGAPRRLCRRDA